MKLNTWFFFTFVSSGVLALGGCSATYQTNQESELKHLNGIGPIRALTVDSTLYTFDEFSYTDSLLSGTGSLTRAGQSSPFKGSVPFRRIIFIERTETSYWKPVWAFPMLVGFGASSYGLLNSHAEFNMYRPSGSSCPYVSSYDGKEFRLEAEAFGTSISKAFEAKTYSILPSLTSVDGLLKVRISNERPETHLINSVNLFAADTHEASSAVLDTENLLWPMMHAVTPTAALDRSGKDVLTDVVNKDRRYWKSDLAHVTPFSGFRDQLEVDFELPANASEATLAIHAINTELISEVYQSVGALLGDATLEFYYALEHDTQLQHNVREWIRDCSLAIEMENENGWTEVGRIPPEATALPFSRAIRLRSLKSLHSPLRFRLSTLTDTWRIDAVSIDFSPAQPIAMVPLQMITAIASDGRDQRAVIESGDSSYALILPPQHIDVTFNSAPTRRMQKPMYVLAAQGYLYEWFPSPPATASSLVSKSTSGADRVAMLKLLMQQKDLFLPPIYASWQKGVHAVGQ
jgi:hypothetical protein